jgi:uncharacterized protein
MKLKIKPLSILIALGFCLVFAASLRAVYIPEKPETYVVDLAAIIDDSVETRLNGFLLELEQKTTAQMIVLTINSLDGESIEDFSIYVAHDKWKLGQAGEDNGLLMLVSVGDRKYRIEVGYGLESVIPDSLAGEIGRSYLVPYFKIGDYSGGIYAASLVLAGKIAEAKEVKITGLPDINKLALKRKPGSFSNKIISILFIIFLAYMFLRHPRALLAFMLLSSLGGRRNSWGGHGGGSFGGFGGGGFSGFGGGGGGGFGGGGASGGW